MNENRAGDEVIVIAWPRERPRLFWLFAPAELAQALRTVGCWASDPEIDFNWPAAGQVSRQMIAAAKQAGFSLPAFPTG